MKRNGKILLWLAIGMLSLIAIFSFLSSRNISTSTKQNIEMRIQEVTRPNKTSFDLQINEQIKKVQTFAEILATTGEIGNPRYLEMMNIEFNNNTLLRVAVAFPDGSFITHDSKNDGNVKDSPFFVHSMKGELFITDPMPAVVDETKSVMLFATPIRQGETVIGSLIFSYLCDDLDKIFNLKFLENEGQILVTDNVGNILMGHTPYVKTRGNVTDFVQQNCIHKTHSKEECFQITGNTGFHSFTMEQETGNLIVSYERLATNDWYMLSIVPESAALRTIMEITTYQRNLSALIVLCAVLYFSFALFLLLSRVTNIDRMTGIPTLDYFKRSAKRMIRDHKNMQFVIAKFDIKNFKMINRLYSFEMGDRVIIDVAKALKEICITYQALYARVGIDDFVLFMPFEGHQHLVGMREEFVAKFKEIFTGDVSFNIEFPAGHHVTPPGSWNRLDISDIYEKVNFAHRIAKQQGGVVVDYAEHLEQEAIVESEIESKMYEALEKEEFALFLQPKQDLRLGCINGAEALVRWCVNGRMIMYPTDFVPVFEKNGFIIKIDMYMFEKTAQHIARCLAQGLQVPHISVNFSRFHLSNKNFVKDLCTIADKYAVPHEYLEIEMTESVVYENVDCIIKLIAALHANGFTLAMDDFGSGYSSLGLLKDIDVDVIKLDKSFFNESTNEVRARTIIRGILQLARSLHIKTVAEGVEIIEHVELLKECDCDFIQGYYFAKPMPEQEFYAQHERKLTSTV